MSQILVFLFTICFSLNNIYDAQVKDISGKTLDLSSFKGKKILFVNISSSEKYKSQFIRLQNLHEKYSDRLVIIASPSNTFGMELKSSKEIRQFFNTNHQNAFIVAEKIEVSGKYQSPLYRWLTTIELNKVVSNVITDDFFKFLVDENGNLIGAFVSEVDPLSSEIQRAITD